MPTLRFTMCATPIGSGVFAELADFAAVRAILGAPRDPLLAGPGAGCGILLMKLFAPPGRVMHQPADLQETLPNVD